MFSRWKERFFILTSNYLQCFKKGTSRITEMGGFIFKLRLSEVRRISGSHFGLTHKSHRAITDVLRREGVEELPDQIMQTSTTDRQR